MKKLAKLPIQAIIGLVVFLAALGMVVWIILKGMNKSTSNTPTLPGGTNYSPSGSGGTSSSSTLWNNNSFPLKLGSGDAGGGSRVANLQKYLNLGIEAQHLGTKLTVDGKFGKNTENIVNVFKQKNGFTQNGEVSETEYNNYILPGISGGTSGGALGGALAGIDWS